MVSINFPSPIITTPTSNKGLSARRVSPSSGADRGGYNALDRRAKLDRRGRRGAEQIMDRRSGPERRRSSIDLSV